ncbi:Hemolysin-type calcium-binding repeat-containing protein [Duganella sp. CF402]|uniref:calcium-binding protein n=1 Tax=unclassified Duganella TaxID=2636909 RepID=UPI0008D2D151|nr:MULTISPECIES: calcium-binding protein [unclassified Duganella]RZT10670.1 hemolysin type calcium-binding protein [Duganella sp. BK701]SEL02905.1 Hemolysin-type calcium-binding repeat-containing protein [Duganella sp. CF402]
MGSYKGTSGNDSLVGSNDSDTLLGLAGNDTLVGGTGADWLEGGDGDDLFFADNDGSSDTMSGGNGNDTFNLRYGYTPSFSEDALDKIDAGNGDDTIRVSFGQSTFGKLPEVTGGAGVDTYTFGFCADFQPLTVSDFTVGAGGDRIDFRELYRENSSDYNLYHGGNPFAAGQLKLIQAGNDTLVQGLAYYDKNVQTILVLKNVDASSLTSANFAGGWSPDGAGTAGKVLTADQATVTKLIGDSFNDTITGNSYNNTLYGFGGDDLLTGGSGNESLLGGYGNDTLYGGGGSDTLSGDGGDNLIDGGDGNDYFYNGNTSYAGKDTLLGGAGDDVFVYGVRGQQATATGGAGQDIYRPDSTGYSGRIVPTNLNVTDFTAGAGGDKIDLMAQLNSNTSYAGGNPFSAANGYLRVVQDGADTRIQLDTDGAAGGGYTYVTLLTLKNFTASTLTADNFVDGLKPDGSSVIGVVASVSGGQQLTGANFDDQLTAISGANTLIGNGGEDTLVAGSGAANGRGDLLSGGAGNDTLIGGDANDQLYGGTGNDLVQGGGGNDTLGDGGYSALGNDTLQGGDGDDLFLIGVNPEATQALAIGGAGHDVFRPGNVYSWTAGRNDGFTVSDFLAGAGGDLIDLSEVLISTRYTGGNPFSAYARLVQLGADTLVQISPDGGGPYYTVLALQGVDKSTLTPDNFIDGLKPDGSHVAGLTLSASATEHRLEGGKLDDTLTGTGGNNELLGFGGDDLLQAGSGDARGQGDSLWGGHGNDTLIGGDGNDVLDGEEGSNLLQGGAGDDVLLNNFGYNNTLEGGAGNDRFDIRQGSVDNVTTARGGDGDDYFSTEVYLQGLSALLSGGAGRDTYTIGSYNSATAYIEISDFSAGDGGDILDVTALMTVAADYGYTGGNPLSDSLGFLRLQQSGADVLLQFNPFGGGDGYAMNTVAVLRNVTLGDLTAQNMVGANPKGDVVPGVLREGTAGSEYLAGGYFNDTLHGNGGNDTLNGGAGDDLMVAGDVGAGQAGSRLNGANGNDTLVGGDGNDDLSGYEGNNRLSGGGGDDALHIVGGNDSVDGGDGDDGISVEGSGNSTVSGGAGNDALSVYAIYAPTINLRFDGGAGNDRVEIRGNDLGASKLTLSGGAGVDTYYLDSPAFSNNTHITDFAAGGGGDQLDLISLLQLYVPDGKLLLDPMAAGYLKLVQQGPNVLVQFDTDGNGSGTPPRTILILDNVKVGTLTANNFAGRIVAAPWGDGYGTYGSDLLEGGTGANRLEAGGGDDTLVSGGGADTLLGGSGNDVYVLDANANTTIVEAANGGLDTVRTSLASYTLGANLEALQYSGDSDFYGMGNASSNIITSGEGNDTLDGNGGGDLLTGLGGDDIYVLRSATDRVIEVADGGNDLVQVSYANAAYTLAANVEYATLTRAAAAGSLTGNDLNNYLIGNDAANTLNGGAGSDTLDGGAAADKLSGGKGDDLYLVDNAGDTITELANEGHDTVETTATKYTLAANVEDLRYTGTSAFAGSGNDLANRVRGGSGNDTLLGGAGNDTLAGGGGIDAIDGGDGDDTVLLSDISEHYTISRANGVVTLENAILGERINLRGIETVVFTDATRTISDLLLNQVSDGDDYLAGTDGDDSINGLAGADTMSGGTGDDRYVVDHVKDTIRELTGEGNDTAELLFKAAATYTLDASVENAEITAAATVAVNVNGNELDNTLTGNAAANTLSGGAGNDILDGGAGADKLIGGVGNDTYRVDNAADVVTEGLNEGIDTVYAKLSSYTLGANMENLFGPGNGVLNGTGNALNNVLNGGLGNDTLSGLAGNDTLLGSVGNDTLLGGDGDDRLEGSIGANLLDGGAGSDTAVALADFSAYSVKRPNATDTVLTNADTGESLILRNVEYVIFNGTLMAIQDVQLGIKSPGNDYIRGGSGDDTLDGGDAGADNLAGGDGNDTYLIDDIGDTIVETADGGLDEAKVALLKAGTYALGANVENASVTSAASVAVSLTGNDGNNTLTGNAAANILTGGAGNDTLDGATGADKLIGGTGNDLYKVDNAGDAITELAAQGTDKVETTLAKYTLSANVENLAYQGTLAFTGTGNELANSIEGSSGNDTLSGLAGDDTLVGGTGNDSLLGGDGADQLDAGAGTDVVDGGTGSDTLVLLGDFADYTRSRPNATDMVLVNTVTKESITIRNVENFKFADGDKVLADLAYNTASTGNDSLFGGDGDDAINGLAGADQMMGGKGDDSYTVDQAGDKVFESADSGDDLVLVAFTKAETFIMGDNVENATITAAAGIAASVTGNALDNALTGNAAANILIGGAGNDTLDGGAGADKLTGGLGDDVYLVDNAGDAVTELASQGTDRIETTLTKYTLSANVEDLLYKGTPAFAGTGNELGNSITGGIGNDTLSGMGGDDILSGGVGNDALLGGNGDDQLDAGTGTDVVDGGSGMDTLTLLGKFSDYSRSLPNANELVLVNTITKESITVRNVELFIFADDSKTMSDVAVNAASTGNDSLTGTDGNDSIDGGAGADTMSGGIGDDTYTIDQVGDVIVESADAGNDLVNVAYTKAGTFVLGDDIENATVTASASVAVSLTGNGLDNILSGNGAANILIGGAGKDTLDGGAGADKMDGGSGDDSYTVDNSGDTITELVGGGRDLVTVKGLSSYSLSSEVEDLVFSGATAFTGNGNILANRLSGGSGADVLNGLAGNDTLTGNAGNDKLLGGDGDDLLTGGDGADTLTGGTGADSFVLSSNVGVDTVMDFVSGTDKLVLAQSVFGIGGDLVFDHAVTKAGPGGFANDAELVILTQNVAKLTLDSAAAAIGAANGAYAAGDKALFALHSGSNTTVYLFTSNGADAVVSAGELTQLATLTGAASTTVADYLFV